MARTPTTARRTRAHPLPRPVTRRGAHPVALLLVASLVAAACTDDQSDVAPTTVPPSPTTIPVRADDGRLVIGVYLPRTGPGAVLGEPMIDAIDQAVRDINTAGGVLDQAVDIKLVDESAGSGLAELVADGVDAIIGPASSTVALSELDDAVQPGTGVVTCSPTATALSLDGYPDNGFFFRTVASDSLLMAAIARRVANTGVGEVALAYLDDPYGRALREVFMAEAAARAIEITANVDFAPDEENLEPAVSELLGSSPSVVVVLADADDGTRLLAEMDAATTGLDPPQVIVNEALRNGRQTIQTLSDEFRERLVGVAQRARAAAPEFDGFFTANAVDCVNLIALSAVQASSDSPSAIQDQMAAVSAGGRPCVSFADCVEKLGDDLQIDYSGLSGPVELSSTTGDLARSWFEVFSFDNEGVDVEADAPFQMP